MNKNSKNWYSEKLLDPRWQRKRLEVLQRSDFACEQCGRLDKTLHVHHNRYIKGRDVWDYEADDLSCLCLDCHKCISLADSILKGNYDDKEVRASVVSFKCLLGLLISELEKSEISSAINFLSDGVSDISPPERCERGMLDRPLEDMIELLLQDRIDSRRKRIAREG